VKTVYSERYGTFIAYEKILYCKEHKYIGNSSTIRKIRSRRLLEIVPPRCNYGYDIIAYIGKWRFLKNRTVDEIVEELKAKGIRIPGSEVSYLSDRFLILVKCLHDLADEKVLGLIEEQGGYILHLDGTSAEDSDHMFTMMDGLSGIILCSIKIRGESQKELEPYLRELKLKFGEPLLIIKDMARGVENACRAVFPNTEIVECHFHFCRDVGKEMFDPYYTELKALMKEFKLKTELKKLLKDLKAAARANGYQLKTLLKEVNTGDQTQIEAEKLFFTLVYGLVQNILMQKRDRSGMGVPFDLPILDLYWNCRVSGDLADCLMEICSQRGFDAVFITRLQRLLMKVTDLSSHRARRLLQLRYKLEEVNGLFTELRGILRFESRPRSPLSDRYALSHESQKEMQDDLKSFQTRLEEELKLESCSLRREKQIIYDHLVRHIDKLLLPVIEIWNDDGVRILELDRTNNIVEHHFRFVKRSRRKAHGRSDIGRDLNELGPYLSYVENLSHTGYFELVFGSWEDFILALSTVPESEYKAEEQRFHAMRSSRTCLLISDEKIETAIDYVSRKKASNIDNGEVGCCA